MTTAPICNSASEKDFSYQSGERQTATVLSSIRLDHSSRYKLAAAIASRHWNGRSEEAQVLDLFCGNGYGSQILANELKAYVTGIDGCKEAIAVASEHYSTPRTTFAMRRFPFELPSTQYDLITCFESLEHVEDPEHLFSLLAASLKPGGILFVSTPNEASIPFALNATWFRHHVKHFRDEEMLAMAAKQGDLRFAGRFGQKVYKTDSAGRVTGIGPVDEMLPSTNCSDAHVVIHLYHRKSVRRTTVADTAPSGSDPFTPGIVDSQLMSRPVLRLDVGCGEAGPAEGHVGVDIRPLSGVGLLAQAWRIEQFVPPGTVTAFRSRHTMEHLTFPQVRATLASWHRLLRPGGKAHIIVPDLVFHIAQFLDPNPDAPSPTNSAWTQRQHALAGFYGWQREADEKLWDVHKSGFTFEILRQLLLDAGFARVSRLNNSPWHLDVEAFKA